MNGPFPQPQPVIDAFAAAERPVLSLRLSESAGAILRLAARRVPGACGTDPAFSPFGRATGSPDAGAPGSKHDGVSEAELVTRLVCQHADKVGLPSLLKGGP